MQEKYRGMTYPKFLAWGLSRKLWRRFMCRKEMHLFSEVLSGGSPWHHYLVCDACQLVVNIESIDDQHTGKGE